MAANLSSAVTFGDRERFNWGFHDATLDAAKGWPIRCASWHRDAAYAAGYQRGIDAFMATGSRPESSDGAWSDYLTAAAK